jgi:SMC interacting uncharacterized protein involved in chromosome segregation
MSFEITTEEYVETITKAARIVDQSPLSDKGYKEQAYMVILSYLLDELSGSKSCFSVEDAGASESEVSDEPQPESW